MIKIAKWLILNICWTVNSNESRGTVMRYVRSYVAAVLSASLFLLSTHPSCAADVFAQNTAELYQEDTEYGSEEQMDISNISASVSEDTYVSDKPAFVSEEPAVINPADDESPDDTSLFNWDFWDDYYGETASEEFDPYLSYNGGVFVSISGSYITESKETILKRLNQIRKEACEKGYPYPNISGRNLTMDDYVPLKWSESVEQVARYRAVEATCIMNHKRTNGTSVFSLFPPAMQYQARAENLAWNAVGFMYGIEQFYEEKQDYLNYYNKGQATGQIGHYESIINPRYTYAGAGCFQPEGDSYNALALNLCSGSGYSEVKDNSKGKTTVNIEYTGDYISKISFTGSVKSLFKGDSYRMQAKATIPAVTTYSSCSGCTYTWFKKKSGKVKDGLTLSSSDDRIATVYGDTITAVGSGKVKISADLGNGKTASRTFSIKEPVTPVSAMQAASASVKFNGEQRDVTVKIRYTNATTSTGKAIKAKQLNAVPDISDFLSKCPASVRNDITVGYKYGNNKKVFVNTNTTKKQPYFYACLQISSSALKNSGLSRKEKKELKAAISAVNKKLKKAKCYFYINPIKKTE